MQALRGDLGHRLPEGDGAIGPRMPPMCRDEDLLGDVLGLGPVADHRLRVAGHPAVVAGIELLERAIVAAAGGGDEIDIRPVVGGQGQRR